MKYNVILTGTYGTCDSDSDFSFATGAQGSCLVVYVKDGSNVAVAHILSANIATNSGPRDKGLVGERLNGFKDILIKEGATVIAFTAPEKKTTTDNAIEAINSLLEEDKPAIVKESGDSEYAISLTGEKEAAPVSAFKIIKNVKEGMTPEEKGKVRKYQGSDVQNEPLVTNGSVSERLTHYPND